MDEIGLAREECGGLKHVDDLGDRRDLRDVVNVGQNRNVELGADLFQDAETFVHAGSAIALVAAAIGLVEARLEDEVDAKAVGDALEPLRRT